MSASFWGGNVFISVRDGDKKAIVPVARIAAIRAMKERPLQVKSLQEIPRVKNIQPALLPKAPTFPALSSAQKARYLPAMRLEPLHPLQIERFRAMTPVEKFAVVRGLLHGNRNRVGPS